MDSAPNNQSQPLVHRPSLEPSKVGQFIALDGCPQYFHFEFNDEYRKERQREHNYKEAFEPLSLLLSKEGNEFEEQTRDRLTATAKEATNNNHIASWEQSKQILTETFERVAKLSSEPDPICLSEVRLGTTIGAWEISGFADCLFIWPTKNGIRIRVFEIKAAHEEKTYQQIQVAVYSLLLRQFLESLAPSYSWIIEGGVIHRNTSISSSSPGELPEFDLEPRELDVNRLLQKNGQFDEIWKENPRNVRYQIAPKCHNCSYKEACQTDAIEHEKTALLGLTRGEQETLAEHGVTTVQDLAELAYPPNDPRPYQYEEPTAVQESKYQALVNETGIGARLPEYIQRAQSYLQGLSQQNNYTPDSNHRPPWIVGSGPGNLPEDNPGFEDEYLSIPRNKLIRVYVNVQYDHRQDRLVMLSAYCSATKYLEQHDPITISCLADQIRMEEKERDQTEHNLLIKFFVRVFNAVREIARKMGDENESAFHWYFYTSNERERVREALERHPNDQLIQSCRDILDHRESIDQSTVSLIQPEIRSRIALPYNNYGLLPVVDCFHPPQEAFPRTNWEYQCEDGTTIDLRTAFNQKFFDYFVPYTPDSTGIQLYENDDSDGFYPSRRRVGAQLPLEYIWSTLGALKEEWINSIDDEYNVDQSINPYLWVDSTRKETRLQEEHLLALGERLAQCLAHVERGIQFRNANITKETVEVDETTEYALPEPTLRRATTEYLQLEHSTQRSELFSHYRLPVKQRVRRGDSIPFVTRNVHNDQSGVIVEGTLLYDTMFDDGDRVAGACRQKGGGEESSGSWMIANEIDRQGNPTRSSNPRDIERGPSVIVEELQMEERYIRVRVLQSHIWRDQEFQRRHNDWTIDPGEETEDTVCFEEDNLFILDPRSDDLTAQRAWNVLQPGESTITKKVEELIRGSLQCPTTTMFSDTSTTDFLEWLQSDCSITPNDRQQAFITEDDAQFVSLQGPPGTGKTSGALAPSILARVAYKHQRGEPLVGVVTGESNKAVTEILDDVSTLVDEYAKSSANNPFTDQLEIVRLCDSPPPDQHTAITYLNYHSNTTALERIIGTLQPDSSHRQSTFTQETVSAIDTEPPLLLVFGTPARIYGLINKLDADSSETISPANRVSRNESFFDLIAVDEASMMRLSSFLMVGAFSHEQTQFLITGDHRQLSPVQQHDWPEETRRIIREYAPFLSVLDYFRAINGDPPEVLPDDTRIAGTGQCPYYQLDTTYRCHETVASFLQKYVYSSDNIEYRSSVTRTLNAKHTSSIPGITSILDSATPLTLVTHDDRSSQQSNITEATLCAEIMSALNNTIETGIVTPHNAQRGRLKSLLGDQIEIETVERYQGGQRDRIIVSATASDPDFLSAEQDFILNPNRLNVALSRMKSKLIVIASESIFELIPRETDSYERSRLWKGLYNEIDVIGRDPDWAGSVQSLQTTVTANVEAPDVTVQVYSFPRIPTNNHD